MIRIDLWLWALDGTMARIGDLTAPEQARAARFVQDRDRMHFIAARWQMRRILAKVTGGEPLITEGPRGKPMIAGGPAFNLSHAGGLAALVVCAEDLPLGVDIEAHRPLDPGLDAIAFAPEERAELAALTEGREAAFFRGWTRKEAVVKATGEGLYADLKSFAVSLGHPRLLRFDGDDPAAWRLCDFIPRDDMAGAIAARTGGREVIVTRR